MYKYIFIYLISYKMLRLQIIQNLQESAMYQEA